MGEGNITNSKQLANYHHGNSGTIRQLFNTVVNHRQNKIIVAMVTKILTFILRAASLRHCWAGTLPLQPSIQPTPPRRTEAEAGGG